MSKGKQPKSGSGGVDMAVLTGDGDADLLNRGVILFLEVQLGLIVVDVLLILVFLESDFFLLHDGLYMEGRV